jgi:hypothetical protein
LLDVYLVCPESSFTSCSTVQGISDHCGVLIRIEWEENYCQPQVERLVSAYHKANVLGLQTFLLDNFTIWANNGRCVEEVWNNFKNIIFESIERFIPHKILNTELCLARMAQRNHILNKEQTLLFVLNKVDKEETQLQEKLL